MGLAHDLLPKGLLVFGVDLRRYELARRGHCLIWFISFWWLFKLYIVLNIVKVDNIYIVQCTYNVSLQMKTLNIVKTNSHFLWKFFALIFNPGPTSCKRGGKCGGSSRAGKEVISKYWHMIIMQIIIYSLLFGCSIESIVHFKQELFDFLALRFEKTKVSFKQVATWPNLLRSNH